MDARITSLVLALGALSSVAATYPTPNFVVTAETAEIAKQVGDHAEHYRRELAIKWLGRELPRWAQPCPVMVKVGALGAGGNTSFTFDRGEVFGWNMSIQGPLDRVLDSVLPHEVSHTIFACHFRRPLPRWADEGAATLAEDDSEKQRQKLLVKQILKTQKRIPLQNLLRITEYPADMQDVLNLYAEGYALCELLVQRGGKERYLKFLADAHQNGWERALKANYGYQTVPALEREWENWIVADFPGGGVPKEQQLADVRSKNNTSTDGAIVRSQNPDPEASAAAAASNAKKPARRQPAVQKGQGLEAPAPRRVVETKESLTTQVDLGQPEATPGESVSIDGPESDAPPFKPAKSTGRNGAYSTQSPDFEDPIEIEEWQPSKDQPAAKSRNRAGNTTQRSPRSKSASTQ